jgi:hypothetical protein
VTVMKHPPRRRAIRDNDAFSAAGAKLQDVAVQDLGLTGVKADWAALEVDGAIFLGCVFDSGVADILAAHGALIFPRFADRPYDPYRRTLYSAVELNAEVEWFGTTKSLDETVYDWYSAGGAYLPDVGEALAQRTHDFSIDAALAEVVGSAVESRLKKNIVGIMGGHDIRRDSAAYENAARAAFALGRDHLIVTGGGPGIMEAGNLGAYLSAFGGDSLERAFATLRQAPDVSHPDYQSKAREVLAEYPNGTFTLSIPTWFYGFEKTSLFASGIAKYFANSIREEGLLALCLAGIIFADGAAGTVQEVFQDAVQNYYGSFEYQSPMVFLGRERWEPTPGTGVAGTLKAESAPFEDLVLVTDSPDEVAAFIRANPARKLVPKQSS